ncbi:MAG: hypothetical protein R3D59_18525 [Paracoccaceae bacterium]
MEDINPFLRFRPNNGRIVAELGNDQDIDLSLAEVLPRGNNEGQGPQAGRGAGRGTGAVARPWGRDMTSDQVKRDNVVSLGKARTQALFPALGTVEAYWRACAMAG